MRLGTGMAVEVLEVDCRRVVRRSCGGDEFGRDERCWWGRRWAVVRERQTRRRRKEEGCSGIGKACRRRRRLRMRRPSLGLRNVLMGKRS